MANILIIGGTGTISTFTVNELLDRGHEVALFNRKRTLSTPNDKIKNFVGDRNNENELKAVINNYSPDVIIDFVCFNKEQAKHVIDMTYKKVKHFIFISTVDTYGYPLKKLPASENLQNNFAVSEYAKQKQECEKLFLSYHDEKEYPVTIVRPLYSLGPQFVLSIFSRNAKNLIDRIKADKPIIVPGDGTTLIQPSDSKDTGRMVAYLAGEEKTFGKIYNCGSPTIMTQDEYVQLIAGELGRKAQIVHIPSDLILSLKHKGISNSLLPELTRFNLAYSLDQFKQDFPDFKWKPNINEGIKKYIENVESGFIQDDESVENLEEEILKHWTNAKLGWDKKIAF